MGLRSIYYLKKSLDNLEMSRDEIERFQVERLDEIRESAIRVKPYKEKWGEVPGSIGETGDVARFPVLSPEEFPEEARGEAERVIYTSGTRMRRPVSFDRTALSWLSAVQVRTHLLQGYSPFRTVSSYWDEEPEQSLLGRIFLPINHVPSTLSIQEQAEMLSDRDPDFLHYFPQVLFSVAKHLDRREEEVGFSPDAVFTHGELLTDHMREFLEATFDTRVLDQYGTTEFGVAAWECPEGGGYHISEDLVYPEVIGSDGGLVEGGGTGDLVLTTLANTETPLFRHRIGDIVELSGKAEDCSCGTSFRKLSRIRGRRRNVVENYRGEEVFPDEVIDTVARFHDLLTFQLSVEVDGFVLRYVPNTGFERGILEEVRDSLEEGEGLAPLSFEQVEQIDRTHGGKIPVIDRGGGETN